MGTPLTLNFSETHPSHPVKPLAQTHVQIPKREQYLTFRLLSCLLAGNTKTLQSAPSTPLPQAERKKQKMRKGLARKASCLIYSLDLCLAVRIVKIRIFYGYRENS